MGIWGSSMERNSVYSVTYEMPEDIKRKWKGEIHANEETYYKILRPILLVRNLKGKWALVSSKRVLVYESYSTALCYSGNSFGEK